MAIADMPIEKLNTYMGTNPKPTDFDDFWDKSIIEMKKTNPQTEFKKADFQSPGAECYDMYFTGVNGSRIYVKHLRPAGIKGKIPALLLFHGYSDFCGDWLDKLAYVSAGFAVFAMDVRGQGGKSEDRGSVSGNTYCGQIIRGLADNDPKKLFFRNVFLDTAELAGIVLDLDFIDASKVYVRGVSQGGGLAIACAALEERISKAAIMYPFLCDYKRVFEMNIDASAYCELKTYFRYNDPCHEKENEIFTNLGYIDAQYLAPRIKAEVLMLTGLMDTSCPPSTQYAAYNKMTCKKTHLLYPDFGHEGILGASDKIFQFLLK